MSTLTSAKDWNRARALKLNEHFLTIAHALTCGAKIGDELQAAARLLNGLEVQFRDGAFTLEASPVTLRKEWDNWHRGGRKGKANPDHIRRPEALLCAYKAGCGGHKAMPRELIQELHRRCTLPTGGRDKHGKSPLSVAWNSLKRDFQLRRALPGIDYDEWPVGAEFPWHDRNASRHKPSRALRAAGNLGASAHKAASAYVSMNYRNLRKCELYTLDDVRLDITCMHEQTGEVVGAVCYILMEVASRAIVAYVIKPCVPDASAEVRRKSITEEDVAELLGYGLQAPGFGIGIGYPTHILFERGTTACSPAARLMLENMTDGRIKTHQTGMVGGVRWIGSPRDKAIGNSQGKGVIESFNRRLHYALLHLPGQRGNHAGNEPQNMGTLGKNAFRFDGSKGGRKNGGTGIDEDEQLAQLNLATGGKMKLRLNNLYFRDLEKCVQTAIETHNPEPGHAYRGHGTFEQVEVEAGVWKDRDEEIDSTQPREAMPETASHARTGVMSPAVRQPDAAPAGTTPRQYHLRPSAQSADASSGFIGPRQIGIYWAAWSKLAKACPSADRHAITRATLGANIPHKKLTPPQWAQLLQAFRTLAHQARNS